MSSLADARRHRQLALPAALLIGLVLIGPFAPSAQAAKTVETTWGSSAGSSAAGLFNGPRDIAVRQATGQVYVADSSNDRVQRLDSNGSFELAFGWDVVKPGGLGDNPANERQSLVIVATGGSFTLTFTAPGQFSGATTANIQLNGNGAAVQEALVNLSNLNPGDVSVSGPNGGPWEIEFTGGFADTNVSELQVNGGNLTGDPLAISLTTLQEGAGYEVCTVAADCKAGSSSALGGGLGAPVSLAINQATGHVYVTGSDARVSEFGPDGEFIRAFGWDVIRSGKAGNVPGDERQVLEIGPDANTGELPTGGTFQMEWRPPGFDPGTSFKTGSVPLEATAEQIEAALVATPVLAPSDISVTGPAGGPWTVDFEGAYADTDVHRIAGVAGDEASNEGRSLPDLLPEFNSEGGNLRVDRGIGSTVRDGGGFEICAAAADCRFATAGSTGRGRVTESGVLLIRAPKTSAAGAGQLGGGGPLAVSPVNGNVFVGGLTRVNEFEPDGDFVRAFGWGVDTGSEQFEICTAASGCQHAVEIPSVRGGPDPFTAHGQFSRGNPKALGVDAAGVVYAAENYTPDDTTQESPEHGKPLIMRFDSGQAAAGDLLLPDPITDSGPVGRCAHCTPGPLPAVAPAFGLEIDPASGNLLYLHLQGLSEVDPSTSPATLVDAHLPNANLSFNGLGLDGPGERLYASVSELGHRILVIGDNPAPPATVELKDTTEIEARKATLSAEITPNGPPGIDTRYRFEYSSDQLSWTAVPIPDESVGDGTSPVAVSKAISGLEANTEYFVRVVALKPLGLGSVTSPIESFKTLALPPEVKTGFPQNLTATTAELTATVNPNNLPTEYRFEYGVDTSYGTSVPVPDGSIGGGQSVPLVEPIAGLQPQTTYHYRIVAANQEGTTVGDDTVFTTRAVPDAAEGRAYEMVTPPFKVVRSAAGFATAVRNNPNVGFPSLNGETIAWQMPFFPLTDDVGSPANNDRRIIRRTPQGWVNETQNTLPMLGGTSFIQVNPMATSGDLEASALRSQSGVTNSDIAAGGFLPTEGSYANRLYTFRKGTGVEGYNPWLSNPEQQVVAFGAVAEYYSNVFGDSALFNDDGSAMVRWGSYAGLAEDPGAPGDDDPADDQSFNGDNIYLQRAADPLAMPTAPKDLVNECTGSGPNATRIPQLGGGAVVSSRECPAGSLVHKRGAVVGGGSSFEKRVDVTQSSATTALSDNARRVFFQSPDPLTGLSACDGILGANTDCPPQLFVRQYDSAGNPVVRWISHSRSVPAAEGNGFTGTAFPNQLIAGQNEKQMGVGVSFQGASRNGDVVYFQTNAPLVPTDPNGGGSITAGSASNASWDLYRYELPASLDADPDTGTLLRVSGGPNGTADPNTNPALHNNNRGSSLRYLSDDGRLAYFVTGGPIAGADESPPTGGTTTPGSATTALSGTTRNLYLFDDSGEGPPQYRFVARLPFAVENAAACASFGKELGFHVSRDSAKGIGLDSANCFRGTPDGRHVVFFTDGRLTGDDTDAHGDVYLYDAVADELVRVSAPPPAAEPYVCDGPDIFEPVGAVNGCNADLGRAPTSGLGGATYGSPNPRGFSGLRHYNVSANPDGTVSVFFESRSELVPEDTNGDYFDTYEWRAGELSLISPGDTEDDSWFSGNSLDGQDVFIWTSARIDPREIDASDFDLYDARRGPDAGFPFTPPPAPCDVLAHACRGRTADAPPERSPSSETFTGPGNVSQPSRRCRKPKVRRRGRCVKPRRHGKRKGARRHGRRERGGTRR